MSRTGQRRDVRYRSNGPPPQGARDGKWVLCQQSGFPTHEDNLVEDEWGLLVDPRFGGYDTNDTEGRFRP